MKPESILYRIKLMLTTYRSKDYKSSSELGLSIIKRDTIPAIVSLTADSFNMMAMPDSALIYYNMSLQTLLWSARQPKYILSGRNM